MDALHSTSTLGELIRIPIARFADRTALVCAGRRFTYREMGENISRAMQALKAQGVKRGDGVAVLSSNIAEAIFVQNAILHLGARLSWLHPMGALSDHQFILEDAEITILIVDDGKFLEKGEALSKASPGLKRTLTFGKTAYGVDLGALMRGFEPVRLRDEAEPGDIAYILYTGGTTGRPKGVIHTHISFGSSFLFSLTGWDWPQENRFLAATPVSHAAGAFVPTTFMLGGTVYLMPAFEADGYLDMIERERITGTFLVPTMIYVLLDHPRINQVDVSSLKWMVYGAAPMSPTRLAEGMRRFGPVFNQIYGQTEATAMVCSLPQEDHHNPVALASCGRPIAGTIMRVLRDDGTEANIGEVGEICIRGPQVMPGYWKREEETTKTLRGGWLHTGDMARTDEAGFFYIVDRSKDMIITGGFNVFPREVEDVLTTHPGVAVAAVIGIPDAKWGEAVMALIVRKPGSNVSAEELIALVKEEKGPVQAPKQIEFADSVPVTPLGKPDKKALRAKYWQGQDRQVG